MMKILLEAVSYLHAKNIVHRDLKPQNLLIADKGSSDTNVVIVDFGFGRTVDDINSPTEDTVLDPSSDQPPQRGLRHSRRMETICGTPNFLAPEIIEEQAYGRGVDVWSLGVVCFIIVSGYAPFYKTDEDALLCQIALGDYDMESDPWPMISEECKDFVKSMLTLDPDERPSTQDMLSHSWLSAPVSRRRLSTERLVKFNTAESQRRSERLTQRMTQLRKRLSLIPKRLSAIGSRSSMIGGGRAKKDAGGSGATTEGLPAQNAAQNQASRTAGPDGV